MIVDHRIYHRVNVDLPGQISSHVLDPMDVRILNLSLLGFHLQGDHRLFELRSLTGTSLDLDLSLTIEDRTLYCRCRVVYKRREGQDKAALGLQILDMSEDQKDLLNSFIQKFP